MSAPTIHNALCAPSTLGEDLRAVGGDQHGVLELRAQAAVRRHRRPPVVPHHALRAPHRQRRLCRHKYSANRYLPNMIADAYSIAGMEWVPMVNDCPATMNPGS
jgi:hypothetical protein